LASHLSGLRYPERKQAKGSQNDFDTALIGRNSALIAVTALLGALLAAVPTAADPEPLRLHPDNPRYFLFRGKPTVLITSGEHYGVILNLDFDYVTYLGELQSRRLKRAPVRPLPLTNISVNFRTRDEA
jgi:hypothetical protein